MFATATKTVCILLSVISLVLVVVKAAPQVQQQPRLSELLILGELTPNSSFIYAQHTETPSDGFSFGYLSDAINFTRIEVYDRSTNGTGGSIASYAGGINQPNFQINFMRSNSSNHINIQVRLYAERLPAVDGSYLPDTVTIEKTFK